MGFFTERKISRIRYKLVFLLAAFCRNAIFHPSVYSGASTLTEGVGHLMSTDDVTFSPLFATSRQTSNVDLPPQQPPISPPAILPVAAETTMQVRMPLVSSSLSRVDFHHHDSDTVNFEYMKHVILKFLLSRDSEASLNLS